MHEEVKVKTDADGRSRSPSVEPVDLPQGFQDTVDVICGDARGLMNIKRARVLYEGHEISPTELEKIGGRGASKKWKTSLRVVNPDGKTGQLIGDWLQSHGLDIRHSQLVRYTGKPSPPPASRPERPAPVLRPAAAKAPPSIKAPPAAKLSKPTSAPKPQPTPSVDLLVHLQSQYIGFIPGDPTVDGVPAELPASSVGSAASDMTVIDVGRMSHEELMRMSRESAPDPLGALLPNQPGVLPEREAHLTGHQSARRSRTAAVADANEAAALIGDYMAGRLADPPWQAFGLNRAPLVCGVGLDLHQLYKAVQSQGGFEATISNKCWGKVATKLGIDKSTHTNASFVLKNTYTKFLLAYETQARALGDRSSSEDAPAKDPPDDQTKRQSSDAPSDALMQDAPGIDPASQEESRSDEAAATVVQGASVLLQETAPLDRGDAPSSAAEGAAAGSSRELVMDDRPSSGVEARPASGVSKLDGVVPSGEWQDLIEPTDGIEQHSSQSPVLPRTNNLQPGPDFVDVVMVASASDAPEVIVLD